MTRSSSRETPLITAWPDPALWRRALSELDFLVMEHLDADQKTMKRAIQDFGAKLDEAGREATGLFYYAGHGIQVNGENYLIPVNAAIQRERDVEIEAVNAAAAQLFGRAPAELIGVEFVSLIADPHRQAGAAEPARDDQVAAILDHMAIGESVAVGGGHDRRPAGEGPRGIDSTGRPSPQCVRRVWPARGSDRSRSARGRGH